MIMGADGAGTSFRQKTTGPMGIAERGNMKTAIALFALTLGASIPLQGAIASDADRTLSLTNVSQDQDMSAAKKKRHRVYIYPRADHGYYRPDYGYYNAYAYPRAALLATRPGRARNCAGCARSIAASSTSATAAGKTATDREETSDAKKSPARRAGLFRFGSLGLVISSRSGRTRRSSPNRRRRAARNLPWR